MTKPVILTGLRANNDLTLGNYFGGMLPIIDMSKTHSSDYQVNMFIPDLHSFTTPINHDELHEQILHNARLFYAAGLPLDNPDIHLYRQSYVPAHSELTIILNSFTGFGEMSRMTQFKEKTSKLSADRVSMGLFDYPVLMAADILLYGASYVPVGDDQSQHLEFTRDIAERLNNKFGELFVVPKPVKNQHEFFGKDQGLRIMDLLEPTKKMSKSDDTGKGVIFLGDDPDVAAKKIMSAATDDRALVQVDRENQPGITNLLEILALLRSKALAEIVKEFEGETRYGDFKKVVAEQVKIFLTNFQSQLAAVDDAAVIAKLEASEAVVNQQANATLYKV
ncbi:MAG: tryptophan--tRNA ligase, partial [Candidatus Saccharimonadales bacterium]